MKKAGVKGSRGQGVEGQKENGFEGSRVRGFEGKKRRKPPTVFNSKLNTQHSKLIFPGGC